VNFLDSDDDTTRVRQAYGDDTYRRLVEVKAKCDPENVFHNSKNIQPATPTQRSLTVPGHQRQATAPTKSALNQGCLAVDLQLLGDQADPAHPILVSGASEIAFAAQQARRGPQRASLAAALTMFQPVRGGVVVVDQGSEAAGGDGNGHGHLPGGPRCCGRLQLRRNG
jgi:Berberine and berberine like